MNTITVPPRKRGHVAWYGFDLDGTLAEHAEGAGIDTIGRPIPTMVERLKQHRADGYQVKIVTARVCDMGGIDQKARQASMIAAWCLEHLGFEPEVTNEKDFAMIALYDDRAIGVVRNTGRIEAEENLQCGRELMYAEVCNYDSTENEGCPPPDASQTYADLETELLGEDHPSPGYGWKEAPIGIYPNGDSDDRFYVSSQRARSLAAQLLRAADDVDAIEEVGYWSWCGLQLSEQP